MINDYHFEILGLLGRYLDFKYCKSIYRPFCSFECSKREKSNIRLVMSWHVYNTTKYEKNRAMDGT